MTAIVNIIVEYAAIISPAIAAILGVVALVVCGLARIKGTVNELKQDKEIGELRQELQQAVQQNKDLAATEKILLDKITNIKDYVDNVKKENDEWR